MSWDFTFPRDSLVGLIELDGSETNERSSWYKCVDYRITKFKSIELQISRWRCMPNFRVSVFYRSKNFDHQAFGVEITLLGLECRGEIYDSRHADQR